MRSSDSGRRGLRTDVSADSSYGPADSPDGTQQHEISSPAGAPARRGRAGAGGRWWVWTGRAVLWAFILVVVFNGVRVPLAGALRSPETEESGDTAARSGSPDESGYPSMAASAFAVRFARVYLNYDHDSAGRRAARLAKYLPAGAGRQLGWNGKGTSRLRGVEVARVRATDARHGVVTLSVLLDDEWMRLAVPVYATGDAMVVSGRPALMPAPPTAQLPASDRPAPDTEAEAELRRQLPGFFEAYAGGDAESLSRYLASGVTLTGFSSTVRFVSLDGLFVPRAHGAKRRVLATVTWRLDTGKGKAGELQQTYQLTVVKRDGRWYVKQIDAAPKAGFG